MSSVKNSEVKPHLRLTYATGHSTLYEKLAESLTVNNTSDYYKIRSFITVFTKSNCRLSYG